MKLPLKRIYRFYLGEKRTGDSTYGSCFVPWWSIGWHISQRDQVLQVGPLCFTHYGFVKPPRFYFRWLGFKHNTTQWMGGCF